MATVSNSEGAEVMHHLTGEPTQGGAHLERGHEDTGRDRQRARHHAQKKLRMR